MRWIGCLELHESQGFLGNVHEQKPHLYLVGADDLGDDKVIGSIVAVLGSFPCHGAGLLQDDFMGMEQTGYLRRRILAALGRAGDQCTLGNVGGHGQGNAAEHLDAFGNLIDEFDLGFEMFVEEQVQRVESGARDLPVVFFIHVAQGHCVGQQLIEIVDAGIAGALVQCDGVLSCETKGLGFMIMRRQDAMTAFDNLGVSDRRGFQVRLLSDGKLRSAYLKRKAGHGGPALHL